MKNWIKIALGLFVVFFAFANPFLRRIVLFLLPLGSGLDDLIEIVALVLLAILLIYKLKTNWYKVKVWFNNYDD